MTPFSEDELKAKVQDGYIVESPEEMTEGYKKALIVQLTVQADTELMSAPSYWRAAQHAPSTTTALKYPIALPNVLQCHFNWINIKINEFFMIDAMFLPVFLPE